MYRIEAPHPSALEACGLSCKRREVEHKKLRLQNLLVFLPAFLLRMVTPHQGTGCLDAGPKALTKTCSLYASLRKGLPTFTAGPRLNAQHLAALSGSKGSQVEGRGERDLESRWQKLTNVDWTQKKEELHILSAQVLACFSAFPSRVRF